MQLFIGKLNADCVEDLFFHAICTIIFVTETMPRVTNRNRGGRFRVTDDTVIPIGVDVEVCPEHLRAMNATRTKENEDEPRKGHRCRIKKLIEWWMTEYLVYFEVGTGVLSAEERADHMKFLHTCDCDSVTGIHGGH